MIKTTDREVRRQRVAGYKRGTGYEETGDLKSETARSWTEGGRVRLRKRAKEKQLCCAVRLLVLNPMSRIVR